MNTISKAREIEEEELNAKYNAWVERGKEALPVQGEDMCCEAEPATAKEIQAAFDHKRIKERLQEISPDEPYDPAIGQQISDENWKSLKAKHETGGVPDPDFDKHEDDIVMETLEYATGKRISANVTKHRPVKTNMIGISGKAGSGKDVSASFIQDLTHGFEVRKFAGNLKAMCSILLNVPIEKFEDTEYKKSYLPSWGMTVREFLQKIGTEAVRDGLHTNAWVISLIDSFDPVNSRWVITDVRFPNEAQAVIDSGGTIIRLERDGVGAGNHPSETALDGRDDLFHYKINNNGTLNDLKLSITEVLHDAGFLTQK